MRPSNINTANGKKKNVLRKTERPTEVQQEYERVAIILSPSHTLLTLPSPLV